MCDVQLFHVAGCVLLGVYKGARLRSACARLTGGSYAAHAHMLHMALSAAAGRAVRCAVPGKSGGRRARKHVATHQLLMYCCMAGQTFNQSALPFSHH